MKLKYPLACTLFCLGAIGNWGFASPSASPTAIPESVDVHRVSEKYWAQGEESQLGIIQNRTYTRGNRMSLDLFTGALSTDPFLSVRTFGGALGWNFDENWGLQAIAWKANASDSAAYESFRKQAPNADVDRNPPSGFYGIQLNRSILYGKAAVLGSTLIYVDVFLLGGAGVTTALNGNSFTPFVGIGQKIHLNRNLSLHIDYRILRFSETLKGPSGTNERTNTNDALQMGIGLLL